MNSNLKNLQLKKLAVYQLLSLLLFIIKLAFKNEFIILFICKAIIDVASLFVISLIYFDKLTNRYSLFMMAIINKALLCIIVLFDSSEMCYIISYHIDSFFLIEMIDFKKTYFLFSSLSLLISANFTSYRFY